MAVSYKKLWKLLIDHDMKKKDLAEKASISSYTIAKMTKGENVTTDIRMIVIGNVFEWCLKNGDCDFEGNMRRSLQSYLDGVMY